MAKFKEISCLGQIGIFTSHSLALILISWYTLIQIGVVQYDAADMFGALLLFSLPISLLLLMLLGWEWQTQPSPNQFLIWSLTLTGLIVMTSGIAWIQLFLFFSSFSGTTFG